MRYEDPERRGHTVYVTRNSEYHMRGDVCVGVRDRQSGQWQATHDAVERRAFGALRFRPDGTMNIDLGSADVGTRLCFEGNALMTSPVEEIRRLAPPESSEEEPLTALAHARNP